MKEFTVTVGSESATIQVPSDLSLANILDVIQDLGCKITEPKRVEPQLEPHEELGISFHEWFRKYVSDW